VAAEGTDSFDAMSRGFSYVYSRPWHFAWYQAVAGVYGWICITFVMTFTVVMCYLGVYAAACGFDWVARTWRDEGDARQNAFGITIGEGKSIANDTEKRLPDLSAILDPVKGETAEARAERVSKTLADAKTLRGAALRAVLEADEIELDQLKAYVADLERLDPGLALLVRQGRGGPSSGDRRLHIINQKAWDLLLSRRHTSTDLYEWGPRALVAEPHPYGRLMFVLNCSITWSGGHSAGPRQVGVDRAVAGRSADELGWGVELIITHWVVTAWLLMAMGLAYGYAVSYVISQQTVIYFLLRKKVDGIEMNEVFEEPEEQQEPLPEITPPGEGAAPKAEEKK
jgi:hypothetical protein